MAIALLLAGAAGPSTLARQTPPSGAGPSTRPRLTLTRLRGPVTLDGFSNEAAWADVAPQPFVQLAPDAGAPPTERTELLLGYDDRYLYAAGRLFDQEPSRIMSTTKRRDAETASAEWFGVVIDSYNDKENALAFFTTPAGLRWDAAVLNDGNPAPDPLNVSWNADWDVATARNDQGWFAELRIPLASLRFQQSGGLVVMGIISWRLIARKNETVIFPAIRDTWGLYGRFKPSQAQEVVAGGIVNQKPLYISPFVSGGIRGGARAEQGPPLREVGLDVKYGVTNNLTLDLTVNPDFAQVEADDVQMNVSRFALFYPEKRPFFQERSAVFDFTFGGSDVLFYSRRVGLENGVPVRIVGGARLIGRAAGWDFGALGMQTEATPSEGGVNVAVARARRRVLNSYSYVGGMVTSRQSSRGADNVGYGLDSLLRVGDNDYLQLAWAQSATPATSPWFDPNAARARVYAERRQMTGLAYVAELGYSGPSYRPELGFNTRSDFTNVSATLFYGWRPKGDSGVLLNRVAIDGWVYRSNSRREVETAEAGPYWARRTKSGYVGSVSPRLSVETVAQAFGLSPDVAVPPGKYRFAHLTGSLATPSTRVLSAEVTLDTGAFYDGRRLSAAVSPRWLGVRDVEIGGTYQLERISFPARSEALTNHIGRFRFSYLPTTTVTVSTLVQYVSLQRALGANVRVRYNPREGVDLWVVYDHSGTAADGTRAPGRTGVEQNRTFLAKYTYTFRTAIAR